MLDFLYFVWAVDGRKVEVEPCQSVMIGISTTTSVIIAQLLKHSKVAYLVFCETWLGVFNFLSLPAKSARVKSALGTPWERRQSISNFDSTSVNEEFIAPE